MDDRGDFEALGDADVVRFTAIPGCYESQVRRYLIGSYMNESFRIFQLTLINRLLHMCR